MAQSLNVEKLSTGEWASSPSRYDGSVVSASRCSRRGWLEVLRRTHCPRSSAQEHWTGRDEMLTWDSSPGILTDHPPAAGPGGVDVAVAGLDCASRHRRCAWADVTLNKPFLFAFSGSLHRCSARGVDGCGGVTRGCA